MHKSLTNTPPGLGAKWLRRWCRFAIAAALSCVAFVVQPVLAQVGPPNCGQIVGSDGGPFDYRNPPKLRIAVVEKNHFTPNIENLLSGNSTVDIGAELDFTLRAFPNHHRALLSMMRLGEKLKTDQPRGAAHTVECYFERATRFQPDDQVARLLYAMFLAKNQRPIEVDQQLTVVTKAAGDNALTHYNAGLVYFDAKLYDKALGQAHKAMALGYTRTDLRDQLISVNRWTEQQTLTKDASAPASN
jgi:hypothetical protein